MSDDCAPAVSARSMLNKVPLITLAFWTIKVMATSVGETGADFLIFRLNFELMLISLLATVVLLSIVGTLITDNMTDHFGISLYVSTRLFAAALVAAFMFCGGGGGSIGWPYC